MPLRYNTSHSFMSAGLVVIPVSIQDLGTSGAHRLALMTQITHSHFLTRIKSFKVYTLSLDSLMGSHQIP
jgi:hypothetical protein